jgi:pimeloyl-ACP methyl ester carboxylesterase
MTGTQGAVRHFGQPGGVPALALHCSLAHSGAWRGLAGHLPGLYITAPDMPGHGRAAPCDPRQNQHEVAAEAAIAVLRAGEQPQHLIGHSFGAVVALRVAQQVPDLVRSLVLFEPVLFCATRPQQVFDDYLAVCSPYEEAVTCGDTVAAATQFHALWGDGQEFRHLPEATQTYFAERIHLINAQRGTLNQDSLGLTEPGRFEAINLPAMILEGGNSPAIIHAINTVLAQRLPHAKRAVVAGAGHMLPITHAEQCAEITQNFLQSMRVLQD